MTPELHTSIRNQLRCRIEVVHTGAVNSEIQLILEDTPHRLTAMISCHSTAALSLAPDMRVIALINAADVLLSTQPLDGILSAQTQLQGQVIRIERGAINDEIILNLGAGRTLAATITSHSAATLDIHTGDTLYAMIKAGNIMLATYGQHALHPHDTPPDPSMDKADDR